MKNTIAESKTTTLIIQVSEMDEHIIRGKVLVGDNYHSVGKVDYWSTKSFNISNNESKAPKHYDNTNGSLYEFAELQGLNSYEFDVIKRIIRCRKKGNFKEDLEKTKFLIDLYLKEHKEC